VPITKLYPLARSQAFMSAVGQTLLLFGGKQIAANYNDVLSFDTGK